MLFSMVPFGAFVVSVADLLVSDLGQRRRAAG
jgi:hypothetical protein